MQEFWENLGRYGRYFITVTLGIFIALFQRLEPLLKNPKSAIALVLLILGIFTFMALTLRAMLGLSPV